MSPRGTGVGFKEPDNSESLDSSVGLVTGFFFMLAIDMSLNCSKLSFSR